MWKNKKSRKSIVLNGLLTSVGASLLLIDYHFMVNNLGLFIIVFFGYQLLDELLD